MEFIAALWVKPRYSTACVQRIKYLFLNKKQFNSLFGINHNPRYVRSSEVSVYSLAPLLTSGIRKFIYDRNAMILFKGVSILIVNINIIKQSRRF